MTTTPIYDALVAGATEEPTDESFFAVERDLGAPMSIAELRRELEVCAWFTDGTRQGELVPLAGFTRHRIVRALMQADATIDALQRVEAGYLVGIGSIIAERNRQIDAEHYSTEGDVGRARELIDAAIAYTQIAAYGADAWRDVDGRWTPPGGWPWAPEFWKPTDDPARDLAKAGALIAAAIDALNVPLAGRTADQLDDQHLVLRTIH